MATSERRTLSIEARLNDLLSKPLTRMEKSMSRFGLVVRRSFQAASIAIGALAAASTAAFAVLLRSAENLDAIAKLSDNLGLTAESLTAIRNGAELANVEMETLGVSMKAFSKLVGEANDGGQKQRETLAALGLTAEQFSGEQLNVVEVLASVADALARVDGAANRSKLLLELFGKSGVQMGALLKEGGDGIRKLEADARALGVVFSRDELKRVEDFKDSWEALGQTFRGIVDRLVVDLSPAFTEFFTNLRQDLQGNSAQIQAEMTAFVEFLVRALGLLNDAVITTRKIFEGLRLGAAMAKQATKDLLDWATDYERTAEDIANDKNLEKQVQSSADEIRKLDEASRDAAVRLEALLQRMKKVRDEGNVSRGKPIVVTADREDETPTPTSGEQFFDGFVAGSKKAIAAWQDFGKAGMDAAQQIVGGGLDGLTDAFTDIITGTKSAKEAFKDFAKAMLADLARIIVKLFLMKALQGFMGGGFEDGGIAPGGVTETRPVRKFAKGGIARRPMHAIFGEGRTAEAFVPLPDNRSIPVTFTGNGGGGGSTTTINITAMDSRDVQRALMEQQGTLRTIFTNQAETRNGMRQVIRRAAS